MNKQDFYRDTLDLSGKSPSASASCASADLSAITFLIPNIFNSGRKACPVLVHGGMEELMDVISQICNE
jgi:hypothetical protein